MVNQEIEKALYLLQELKLEPEENDRLNLYLANENYELAVVWLRKKRITALTKLHECQMALDNLDLLVYQVKKLENERMEEK